MKAIFYRASTRRARVQHEAWQAGLAKHGLELPSRKEEDYSGVEADVAIFYGLQGNLRRVMAEYAAAGKTAVFVDLGFWGRVEDDKVLGFHRLAVNAKHATGYFQKIKHPADRWSYFGRACKPFTRSGRHVLLCGMSAKASWVYEMGPEEWERRAAKTLRETTLRPILYRPKPSWRDASPIKGTSFMYTKDDIRDMLVNCWAVATHHGNTALDALIEGVPAFCEDGLASALCPADLKGIEAPHFPDEAAREQLLCDAAYTQYKVNEIAEGKAWAYLRDEGLVPG